MTVRTSISLTDDRYCFVRKLVDCGHVPSVSAALQQGVYLLRQRFENDDIERAALGELLQRRRACGVVSGAGMDARFARLLARKRRAQIGRE